MSAILSWCGAASSFLLFSALAWRMLATPRPARSIGCRFRWIMWGVLHIGACMALVAYLVDHWRDPAPADWHLCLLRTCIALMLMYRWRRREDSLP